MLSGVNHQFNLLPGASETPVVKFGEALKDQSGESKTFLQTDTKLKIRVDRNLILIDFKAKGFYTTVKSDKIY